MSQRDASGETDDDTGGHAQELAETGREYVPAPPRAVRRRIDSGAVAAVGAGAAIISGLRALRRGDGQSGFVRLLVGGVLATVAVAQRRSPGDRERDRSDVEQTDVVDTSPDVEDVAREDDEEAGPRATGEESSDVVDTSPGIEGVEADRDAEGDAGTKDAEPGRSDEGEAVAVDQTDVVETGVDEEALDDVEGESDGDARESHDSAGASDDGAEGSDSAMDESGTPRAGSYERLGEAAFDEQSGRVPAPQEAFNRGLLSSGAEAFWGVRESDDAVVVSLDFDSIDGADEFRYVASSEVDDDRGVRIPDTVQNHWDDVAGGGTTVTSGTGIVFATADELQDVGLLLVVPEQWSDDLLGDTGE